MFGEKFRFWLPVVALVGVSGYTGQKLVRAHFYEMPTPNYDYEKEDVSMRGSVYDSTYIDSINSRPYPLVKSTSRWAFRLDPVAMTSAVVRVSSKEKPRPMKAQARTIANVLKMDYNAVLRMCRGSGTGYRNQFLGYSCDQRVYDILTNPKYVAGVMVRETHYRHYYEDTRLAHVLCGVEEMYNKELRGIPGRIRGKRDGRGNAINEKPVVITPAIRGADVYLTIDHRLQREAEEALVAGIDEYGAARGWCVMLDSQTGEVLAMASSPSFDPRYPTSVPDDARRNMAISMTYEPGSVMKVITASAAIDLGVVRPNTLYNTDRYEKNGYGEAKYYKLPGDAGHVWEPRMSVRDAIVHSSNIVIGKLGYELGPTRLHGYMKRFGFGSVTGIELPQEEKGLLRKPENWDMATRSRAAIGQGVAVTALQMASAYQAIANDGVRVAPRIVKRIVNERGEVVYEPPQARSERVISAKTSLDIREMMLDVASPNGTARRAALRGYSVAGKTGTAQKVVGRTYAPGIFRATFCGIVPSGVGKRDEADYVHVLPRVVILVTLDFDEKRLYHQGGNSAGPVFRRIAKGAMRILEVPPDRPDELLAGDDDEYDRISEERARKVAEEDPVWDGVPLWTN